MFSESDVILIGKKPIMDYVVACLNAFSRNEEIFIRARGRAISSAVDVAEVLRNRFLKDVAVSNIEIGTELLESFDGREKNVSTIDICLSKV